MRFLFLFCLLLVKIAAAQKPFEGVVVYRLHATVEKNENAELVAFFAPNRIKLRIDGVNEREQIIIRLDSGAVHFVNYEDKTYRTKKLRERKTPETASAKTIAGYRTSPVDVSGKGLSGLLGGMGAATAVVYAADSLYYVVPDKYADNTELLIVQNNRIVLGGEMTIGPSGSSEEMNGTEEKFRITAEAKTVTPQTISPNEFAVPEDFAVKLRWPYLPEDSSLTDTFTDTTYAPVEIPKKAAPKKPAPKAKPTPAKPPLRKPKT